MLTATGPDLVSKHSSSVPTHSVQVNVTGSPTAVTVDLEGSLDGVKWFQLAEHVFSAGDITAQAALFHVIDRAVPMTRGNLTTLTGGTTPTVTILIDSVRG